MSIDTELERSVRPAASRRRARAKYTLRSEQHCVLPLEALTARRLIELLEHYDPEAPVVIEGQYGGFEWVRGTSRVPLRVNVNSLDGFGPHARAELGKAADTTAVAIQVRPEPPVF